jgi:hypothetical protein
MNIKLWWDELGQIEVREGREKEGGRERERGEGAA